MALANVAHLAPSLALPLVVQRFQVQLLPFPSTAICDPSCALARGLFCVTGCRRCWVVAGATKKCPPVKLNRARCHFTSCARRGKRRDLVTVLADGVWRHLINVRCPTTLLQAALEAVTATQQLVPSIFALSVCTRPLLAAGLAPPPEAAGGGAAQDDLAECRVSETRGRIRWIFRLPDELSLCFLMISSVQACTAAFTWTAMASLSWHRTLSVDRSGCRLGHFLVRLGVVSLGLRSAEPTLAPWICARQCGRCDMRGTAVERGELKLQLCCHSVLSGGPMWCWQWRVPGCQARMPMTGATQRRISHAINHNHTSNRWTDLVISATQERARQLVASAMGALLPGIDANDEGKALAAFQFFAIVLSSIGTLPVSSLFVTRFLVRVDSYNALAVLRLLCHRAAKD